MFKISGLVHSIIRQCDRRETESSAGTSDSLKVEYIVSATIFPYPIRFNPNVDYLLSKKDFLIKPSSLYVVEILRIDLKVCSTQVSIGIFLTVR